MISGVIALLCSLLGAVAVDFNLDAFSDPKLILTMQGVHVALIRWSMVADLFGYYLLLLPAIFYLHDWMKGRTPWRNLLTFCGSSYVLIGAIGASILAAVWPPLMLAFPGATAGQQENLQMSFNMFSDLVYRGMWNRLEVFLGGIWWLGVGAFLRKESKVLGIVTIVLGIFTILDGIGAVMGVSALSELGLNVYLILAPLWALWFGVALMRGDSRLMVKMTIEALRNC